MATFGYRSKTSQGPSWAASVGHRALSVGPVCVRIRAFLAAQGDAARGDAADSWRDLPYIRSRLPDILQGTSQIQPLVPAPADRADTCLVAPCR